MIDEVNRAATAAYRFTNRWLRRLITFATIWPAVMIAAAGMGDWNIKVGNGFLFTGGLLVASIALIVFAIWSLRVRDTEGWTVGGFSCGLAAILIFLVLKRGQEIKLIDAKVLGLILAFVPLVALIYAAIKIPPLLWAGPAAVYPKLLWPPALGLIANCLLGAYLYLVPVANDAGLLATLVLVTIPLALLHFFEKAAGLRKLLTLAAVGITLVICLGGRAKIGGKTTGLLSSGNRLLSSTSNPRVQQTAVNRGSHLCENAFESAADYANRDDLTHVKISLTEGCWSGWVKLPRWWKIWYYELEGSDGAWVAGWPENLPPSISFRASQQISFCQYCAPVFRLQGKGTLVAYTNASRGIRRRDGGVIMNDDKAAGGEGISRQPQHETSSPPGTAKQVGGFLYTLGECRLRADYLSCSVQVTNREEERNLSIENNRSRIVDSLGHEHLAKRLAFGATKDDGCCWVETVMPPDVPFELTLGFEQVPPESTAIRFMELGGNKGVVKFYGVPVSK